MYGKLPLFTTEKKKCITVLKLWSKMSIEYCTLYYEATAEKCVRGVCIFLGSNNDEFIDTYARDSGWQSLEWVVQICSEEDTEDSSDLRFEGQSHTLECLQIPNTPELKTYVLCLTADTSRTPPNQFRKCPKIENENNAMWTFINYDLIVLQNSHPRVERTTVLCTILAFKCIGTANGLSADWWLTDDDKENIITIVCDGWEYYNELRKKRFFFF